MKVPGDQPSPPGAPSTPTIDPNPVDPTKGASKRDGSPSPKPPDATTESNPEHKDNKDDKDDAKVETGDATSAKNHPKGPNEEPEEAKKASEVQEIRLPAKVTFKPSSGTEQKVDLPPAFAGIRKDLIKCGAKPGDLISVRVKGQISVELKVAGRACATTSRKIELADGVLEMRVQ
jgi:hypothetical protein